MESPTNLYSSLDCERKQVRILHILPDLDQARRIACNLETISLNDNTHLQYEAISWCWGNIDRKREILVNGQVVEVPENAEHILRRLCFEQGHVTIWIDAVCINQSDIEERGHQVSRMKDLYYQAERVLIWLGDEAKSTPKALESIDILLKQCRDKTGDVDDLAKIFFERDGNMQRYSQGRLPDFDWNALIAFYSFPWFFRLWVVQEAILPREAVCFCGQLTRPWTDVSLAAQWLVHHEYWKPGDGRYGKGIAGVKSVGAIYRHTTRPSDLATLLHASTSLQSSVGHDKVYGMLGLLQSNPETARAVQSLVPDYRQPLENLYAAATKAAIQSRQDSSHPSNALMLLEFAAANMVPRSAEQESRAHWPSWVPHFDWVYVPAKGSVSLQGGRAFNPNATAGLPTDTSRLNQGTANTLSVRGIIVDEVSTATQAISLEAFNDTQTLKQIALMSKQLAASCGPNEMHFALTLTSAHARDYGDARATPERLNQHIEYMHEFMKCCENDISRKDWSQEAESYAGAVWEGGANRRFAITSKGRMAMVPRTTGPRDLICLLFGSSKPWALRKMENHYVLLGTVFVPDLMQGQYIGQLQSDDRLEKESLWFDIH